MGTGAAGPAPVGTGCPVVGRGGQVRTAVDTPRPRRAWRVDTGRRECVSHERSTHTDGPAPGPDPPAGTVAGAGTRGTRRGPVLARARGPARVRAPAARPRRRRARVRAGRTRPGTGPVSVRTGPRPAAGPGGSTCRAPRRSSPSRVQGRFHRPLSRRDGVVGGHPPPARRGAGHGHRPRPAPRTRRGRRPRRNTGPAYGPVNTTRPLCAAVPVAAGPPAPLPPILICPCPAGARPRASRSSTS